MITKSKIKQLEQKCRHISSSRNQGFTLRDIAEDGRLLDKDDYVMTDEEVNRIKDEDNEIIKRGGRIICLTSYSEPKLKSGSATVPYFVDTYKGESGKWAKK